MIKLILSMVLIFLISVCNADVLSYCDLVPHSMESVRAGFNIKRRYGFRSRTFCSNAVEHLILKTLNTRIGVFRSGPIDRSLMPGWERVETLRLEINKNADATLTCETKYGYPFLLGENLKGIINDVDMFFPIPNTGFGLWFTYGVVDDNIYALLSPYGKQIPIRFRKIENLDKAVSLPQNNQHIQLDNIRLSCQYDYKIGLNNLETWYKCVTQAFLARRNVDEFYLFKQTIPGKQIPNLVPLRYYKGYYWRNYEHDLESYYITRDFFFIGCGYMSIHNGFLQFVLPPPGTDCRVSEKYEWLQYQYYRCKNPACKRWKSNRELERLNWLRKYLDGEKYWNAFWITTIWSKTPLSLPKTVFTRCYPPNITTNNFRYINSVGNEYLPHDSISTYNHIFGSSSTNSSACPP